jgi:hypothetical protein
MSSASARLLVSSADLTPTRLSPDALIDRISSGSHWPEASIHPAGTEFFPRLGIEFHRDIGYSILCHEDELSWGFLAAREPTTSAPTVPVNLGGQVVETWPPELFLTKVAAAEVLQYFFAEGRQNPAYAWLRLDGFQRELVYEGPGLMDFWSRLVGDRTRA